MIYTQMIKKAMKICFEQHKNQIDKSGIPYVFHPIHIAEQMKDEDSIIVALLHDVIEDTNLTLNDLARYGFNQEVLNALKCMTHDKSISYFDYIKGIGENSIARKVKIADLQHNSNLARLEKITSDDLKRMEKYKKSLNYLIDIERNNYIKKRIVKN